MAQNLVNNVYDIIAHQLHIFFVLLDYMGVTQSRSRHYASLPRRLWFPKYLPLVYRRFREPRMQTSSKKRLSRKRSSTKSEIQSEPMPDMDRELWPISMVFMR